MPAGRQPEPGSFLLGRRDALALLVVRAARRATWPLLWFGVAAAAAVGRTNQIEGARPSTLGEAWDELASPLAGIVAALGLRILADVVAYVLAFRLASSTRHESEHALAAQVRTATDRYRLTRAYQQLRWTHLVRDAAAELLGPTSARFAVLDRAITIANPILLATAVAALAWCS